ncbi:MAG TPA: alpha-glucuronidase family glycosyl hydrolase [Gemmatimonadaceae bacterium]|nr:alpha-glucuronidase family glycosyl hydrolase [Gemmatimonadaceae bacterium]
MRVLTVPLLFALGSIVPPVRAESGYELWLRYRRVADGARLDEYRRAFATLAIDQQSATMDAVRGELTRGLRGLLDTSITIMSRPGRSDYLVVGTRASVLVGSLVSRSELASAGTEGFVIRRADMRGRHITVVAANSEIGVLYGVFAFLRELQMSRPLDALAMESSPRIKRRLLDHWDNLDRTVERGYAGRSLWDWSMLPDTLSPRYTDYARANASVGINGVVLTNVNANAKVLTPEYLAKVAALANVFRPYGITVYLTARFAAPLEIGDLRTADPLDPAVRAWWRAKADEIYRFIPDFGGFLVKANSEGQPGPQDYHRSHADGANMLADAVAPHHGVVMWRAFVYSNDVPTDRVKQAYDEFTPLDRKFRANVLLQTKNGPLDFQPREPFHPLFGAMPNTPQVLEFQITKEYLGEDTHLVYLAPLFSEVLNADTYARGKGSTVARVVDGSLQGQRETGIAGVANIGSDTTWTGSQFNAANWYAFARLAWDPSLTPQAIADEWIRQTFSNDAAAVRTIAHIMLVSREAAVNYMTPLGLAHQMGTNHHYGPAPWVRLSRADWSPVYYNKADSAGIGFDRTSAGSNAVAQYFPPVRDRYASRATVPDSLLLWFHHVGWTERMRTGRTLWDELALHYQAGVDTVRSMQRQWASVRGAIDAQRFDEVQAFLAIQEREARWWRDASLQYFTTLSHLPLPAGVEPPSHDLKYYMAVRCPRDEHKPRCEAIP